MNAQSLFEFDFRSHKGQIRAMREEDVPKLVAYWHESSPDYLVQMGVDLTKLSSREATERKFLGAIAGDGPRKHVAMVVELDGRLIAYTNAYVDDEQTGYPHVHVLDPELRRHGLARQLFATVIRLYFEHYKLRKLILQTNPENVGVNAMLQSFGHEPRQLQDDNPSGMARAGLFNVYEITP